MAGFLNAIRDKVLDFKNLRRRSAPPPPRSRPLISKPVPVDTWCVSDGYNAGAVEPCDRQGFDDLFFEPPEALRVDGIDATEELTRFIDSVAYDVPEPKDDEFYFQPEDLNMAIEGFHMRHDSVDPQRKNEMADENPGVMNEGSFSVIHVHDASPAEDRHGSDDGEPGVIMSQPDTAIGESDYGIQRKYSYKKLPNPRSIRVLSVKRRASDYGSQAKGDFWYSLEMVSLDDAPRYEAVSYVWGDNYLRNCLVLEDGSFIMITASLAEALPRLAQASITGYLWIDQLCIDQTSLAERSHQIKIMGEIYRQSLRALIFLSHHKLILKHLLPLISYATNINARRLKPEYLEEHISAKLETKESLDYFRWMSVVTLFKHPWFTRAWVFQEAVLAPVPVFVIRDRIVPFDVLVGLASAVNKIEIKYLKTWRDDNCVGSASGYDHLQAMARLRRSIQQGVQERDFWELLSDIAPTSECSIPVDILYAFLGLLRDDKVQLEPDYSHNVLQAFIATTRAVIFGRKSLDIFGFLERENEGEDSVSWVPRWKNFAAVLSLWSPSKPSPFDAAKNRAFDGFENGRLSSLLPVRGCVIDAVVAVAPPFVSTQHWLRRSPASFLNLTKVGEVLAETAGVDYAHCQETRRLLQVAMADGLLPREHQPNTLPGSLISKERMDALHEVYETLQQIGPANYKPRSVEERELCFLARIAFNRCICVTEKGNLALVPMGTRIGDAVAVLHGSKVPLILRDQPGTRIYRVVGQAYIENVMHGEAVTWAEKEAQEYVLT